MAVFLLQSKSFLFVIDILMADKSEEELLQTEEAPQQRIGFVRSAIMMTYFIKYAMLRGKEEDKRFSNFLLA